MIACFFDNFVSKSSNHFSNSLMSNFASSLIFLLAILKCKLSFFSRFPSHELQTTSSINPLAQRLMDLLSLDLNWFSIKEVIPSKSISYLRVTPMVLEAIENFSFPP